jgi:hypothetical protein
VRNWIRSSPQIIRDPLTRHFGDDVDKQLADMGRIISKLQAGKKPSSTGANVIAQPAAVVKVQSQTSLVQGSPAGTGSVIELLNQTDTAVRLSILTGLAIGGMFLVSVVVNCLDGDAKITPWIVHGSTAGAITNDYMAIEAQLALAGPTPPSAAYTDCWAKTVPIFVPPPQYGYPTTGVDFAIDFTAVDAFGAPGTFKYDLHIAVTAL